MSKSKTSKTKKQSIETVITKVEEVMSSSNNTMEASQVKEASETTKGSKMSKKEVTLGNGEDTIFIRPSKLEKPGKLFEAVYMGTTPNKFNEGKPDFTFKAADGKKYIVNNSGKLAKLMELVEPGTTVEVEYLGQNVITGNSPFKGKKAHDWKVSVFE